MHHLHLELQEGQNRIEKRRPHNNGIDKLVLENCRWVISEFLRVFWTADRRQVAAAIRRIVQYDVPVIGVYDGCPLVQRVDCSAEEEVLILLHHAGEEGLIRTEIGRAVPRRGAYCHKSSDRTGFPRTPRGREVADWELSADRYRHTPRSD